MTFDVVLVVTFPVPSVGTFLLTEFMLAVPTIASPCIIAKTINVLKIELPPLLISGKVTL